MMSAEGLITLERVTLDGTKIKANPGGNTFRRKQKLEAHLELAREQVRVLNAQAEDRRDGEAASCGATARGAGGTLFCGPSSGAHYFANAMPTRILRKRAGAAPWPVPMVCMGCPLPQLGVPQSVQ